MLRGDRPPPPPTRTLRWPVTADALYRAIDLLCGIKPVPRRSLAEPRTPTAAIDAVAFLDPGKIGRRCRALIEILQCYVVTAEQLTNSLADACGEEKWDEAARLAQDIIGAAGGLGLACGHPGGAAFRAKDPRWRG